MNKKNAIKVLSATAVAATAFVATSPADASVQTDAQKLVNEAKNAGTVLKWAISTEGSADGTTRPWAQYNAAKAARDKAVAAVNKLPASQKAGYLADLEANVNLHITRAMYYIDAITAGEKIKAKQDVLSAQIAKGAINDATETAYHELSKEIRKQGVLLDRVYGKSTRDEIRGQYKQAAEAVRDSALYAVTVKMELDLAGEALESNNMAEVEKHLAEANKYISQVQNATMKATLTKSIGEVEAQLTPVVKAVSALNAKEVSITFNKEIKADSVITASTKVLKNITVSGPNSPTFTAELSSDKKTVVLTANTGLNGEYTVNINKEAVETTNGDFVQSYISKFNVNDTTAPSIAGAERVSPTISKVNFSEPISNAGTVSFKYTDGSAVVGASFNLDASGKFGTVDLSANTVETNKAIVVQFIGAMDYANNLLTPNPATVAVQKGEKDGVAPTVSALNVVAPNKVEVKFSEEVTGFTTSDVTGVAVSEITKSETDPTKYVLTLSAPQNGVKTVGLVAGAVTDLSGETSAAYSKLVEFKADAVAPVLASAQVTKDAKDGKEYLVLAFDKAVTLKDTNGFTLTGSSVKDYVTNNSASVTVEANELVAVEGSSNSFKVALADLNLVEGTAYTLNLPSGLVQNVSAVENAAKTGAIKFTRGTDSVVGNVSPQAVNTFAKGTGNSQVLVTFNQEVDGATATNPANYTIDGAVVEKAEILDPAKKIVTLTLKSDSVTFTGLRNYSVSGVKTALGGILENTARGTINLTENVAPTVTSAVVTSPDTIKLTFSEAVRDGSTPGSDFEIFQGTSTTPLAEALTGEVINGNEVTITLSESLSSLSGLSVKASNTIDIVDVNGNATTFKQISIQ